uniref:Gag-Pol polyprotein n=1 Tax=Anthurium amnicola TaxID=1678845 RepID=A0A1D1ZJC7_9ARAE
MLILKIEERFRELEHYAPHIYKNEVWYTAKFICGLNNFLRSRLIGMGHTSMSVVIKSACLYEGNHKEYLKAKHLAVAQVQKTKSRQTVQNPKKRKRYNATLSASAKHTVVAISKGPTQWAKCMKCDKRHGGIEYYRATDKCFGCGQAGYMLRDCPKKQDAADRRLKTRVRVLCFDQGKCLGDIQYHRRYCSY